MIVRQIQGDLFHQNLFADIAETFVDGNFGSSGVEQPSKVPIAPKVAASV